MPYEGSGVIVADYEDNMRYLIMSYRNGYKGIFTAKYSYLKLVSPEPDISIGEESSQFVL